MISRSHQFADRVLSLIPINSLDRRLQDRVLEQGHLLEYKKKKKIFKEGAKDSYTFYLLDGELELQTKGEAPVRMSGGDSNSLRALAQLLPRRYTAVALSEVTIFRIDRGLLDQILSNDQVSGESGMVEVEELEDEEGADWMTRLISSELFTRLPHDNIQRFFTELEAVPVSTGDVVVEQGTEGDYLYIVAEGKCSVVRRAAEGGQEHQLAVLRAGDVFGEEALISNEPRNASVKMMSPGFVMRLPKQKFLDLVSNPTLHAVDYDQAQKMAKDGAVFIDVRFPDEHSAGALDNSRNIPLNVLRMEAPKLDSSKSYVVFCDTGARSSTGAFLLAREGLDVSYLAGGLDRAQRAMGSKSRSRQPAVAERKPAAETEAPAKKPQASAAAAPKASSSKESPAASGDLRAQFAQLKAERDKAAVRTRRAAEAVAEVKRRYEKQHKLLDAERSKRQKLEKDLEALKADAERTSGIELSRLTSELDKAIKKSNELQKVRENLEEKLKSVQLDQQAALEKTGELQMDRVQVEKLKHEREVLGTQLEQAKAELEELRNTMSSGKGGDARKSEAASLSKINATRKEAEAKIAKERKALEQDIAAQQERDKILRKKEKLLEEKRAAAEAEYKQREKAVAKAEAALSSEKAGWKNQLDKAIADERARLEASYEKYKKETEATAQKRAQELAGQMVADARAEFEAKIAEIRAEADARVGRVRSEFKEFAASANARTDALVAKVGSTQAAQPQGDNVLPQSPGLSPQEPDLTIEETTYPGQAEDFEAKEPVSAAPVLEVQDDGGSGGDFIAEEPSDPVPAIDMEIEAVGQSLEDYLADDDAGPLAGDVDDDDVPTLEEVVSTDQDGDNGASAAEETGTNVPTLEAGSDEEEEPDGKERVLTPDQIADIRKKMQAKMKATKKSA